MIQNSSVKPYDSTVTRFAVQTLDSQALSRSSHYSSPSSFFRFSQSLVFPLLLHNIIWYTLSPWLDNLETGCPLFEKAFASALAESWYSYLQQRRAVSWRIFGEKLKFCNSFICQNWPLLLALLLTCYASMDIQPMASDFVDECVNHRVTGP